jgi:hypothetical protein
MMHDPFPLNNRGGATLDPPVHHEGCRVIKNRKNVYCPAVDP